MVQTLFFISIFISFTRTGSENIYDRKEAYGLKKQDGVIVEGVDVHGRQAKFQAWAEPERVKIFDDDNNKDKSTTRLIGLSNFSSHCDTIFQKQPYKGIFATRLSHKDGKKLPDLSSLQNDLRKLRNDNLYHPLITTIRAEVLNLLNLTLLCNTSPLIRDRNEFADLLQDLFKELEEIVKRGKTGSSDSLTKRLEKFKSFTSHLVSRFE